MQVNFNKSTKTGTFGGNAKVPVSAIFTEKVKRFPKDLDYLKLLAKAANIPESELCRLNSVIGPQQLENILKSASRNIFDPNSEFYLNLHIHTSHSDGLMSVDDLLEQSVQYANQKKTMEKFPNFSIAITDHDTFEGAKEALKKIVAKPEMYKNLGVVLGAELSSLYRNEELLNFPFAFEMVAYSINPFDKDFNKHLKDLRDERVALAKNVVKEAQKIYPQYKFSYAEACEMSNNPKKGIDGFLYSLASYFKTKSNSEVDNKKLENIALQYLPTNEGQQFRITNSIPDLFRLMENKFGFLGIAHPAKIFLGDGILRNDYIEKCKRDKLNTGRALINCFVDYLAHIGKEKFKGIETNYQAYKGDLKIGQDILNGKVEPNKYHQGTVKWLENFRCLAEKYNLLETGGLDTHGVSPFIIH